MSSTRFEWSGSALLNCCQQSGSWLLNHCSQAKTWVSSQLDSKPVLKARSAVHGAVNAALGVHYCFDLGLALFPATSPWYNAIKGIKYAATGICFVVSTYTAYHRSQKVKTNREKLVELEEKLIQIDKMLSEAEQICIKADSLLTKAGYGDASDQTPPLEVKETKSSPSSTSLKSKMCDLIETKPARMVRAAVDGAIKATGVHYIFDMGSAVIPVTQTFNTIRDVIIGTTLVGSTLSAFGKGQSDALAREKLIKLKQKVGESFAKLRLIQQRFGSKEELDKIMQEGSAAMQRPFQSETKEMKTPQKEEKPSLLSRLTDSKPLCYANAAITGATKASGVHYIFEKGFSELPAVKYIASGVTLMISSIRSFDKNKAEIKHQEELKDLDQEIEETRSTLMMAHQIIKLQEEFVQKIVKPTIEDTPIPEDSEDELNKILSDEFEQMELLNEYKLEEGLLKPDTLEIELKEIPSPKTQAPTPSVSQFSFFKPKGQKAALLDNKTTNHSYFSLDRS